MTYRPKKIHFFPKLTKNINSTSVVIRLCKPLEEKYYPERSAGVEIFFQTRRAWT